MKKTWSLVIAIVLSVAIGVTNLSGLSMVVRADDAIAEEGAAAEPTAEDVTATDPDPAPAPEPDPTPAVDPAEQARQEALERQAAEAAALAEQQAQEEAAALAKQKAEEEAARQQAEAEAAAQAAEDAKRAEEQTTYKLSSDYSTLNFGTVSVGGAKPMTLQITNVGKTTVDLVSSEKDPDGAFLYTLDGPSNLAPSESTTYTVSLSPSIQAGKKYTGSLVFWDSNLGSTNAITVSLKATVTGSASKVTKVKVTPSKVTLATGDRFTFTATPSGSGDLSEEDFIWSMTGAKSSDTQIIQDGTVIIGSDETSSKITVKATSMSNPKASGSAAISVQTGSYNVSATPDPKAGGVVTGGGAVAEGGSVTLSAVPNKNYAFVGWVQNGKTVSTATNYTVSNVTENVSLTAKFKQNYVTVTAVPDNTAGGTVVGGGNIPYGGKTTLSAKANAGYVFSGWKEGNTLISTSASLELNNLTANRSIVGVFTKTAHTITLAASPAEGGKVSGGGTFDMGKGTTVQAVPNTGWAFQGWAINGQIVSHDASVKIDDVDKDYSFTAVFVKTGVTTFTVSAGVATTGGSITPSGKTVVPQGQSITYTITPKAGYAILAVAVDGAQVGPVSTYTFTNVQGPHTIAAAFLLTDAGKAAAESAGKTTQSEKVQKIEKTEANTATEESTVSIEDAADGTGGDDFVEEMDLTGVTIPTDEELGVSMDDYENDDSDVVRAMGLSYDEVTQMIANGNTAPVIQTAFYEGTFNSYVDNSLAPTAEVDYHTLTDEELLLISEDDINPSLPNLDVVVEKLFTENEVQDLADGGTANITISLTKLDNSMVSPVIERVMGETVGQKPLQYFDLTFMKSVDGDAQNVTDLPEAMEVVVAIPDEIYKSGKTYSILRYHNGEVKVLPDLDDDPKTITFRTDKFSTYAISEEVATTKQLMIRFAIGALIAFAVAITCLLILMVHQAKIRQAKRKARKGQR